MAAEVLIGNGLQVDVYDAMPSVGRKFLMAGKGGMNITHAEAPEPFRNRYGARKAQIAPLLDAFGPEALRAWVHGLGIDTFVGSSGRVFPTDMKAAPLLRAWLQRLRQAGVGFHMRHRWNGWVRGKDGGEGSRALRFLTPEGERVAHADAIVLALGGGSWARLGSDGAWVQLLAARGIKVAPLRPSNCGFELAWSEHFGARFAGAPVKSVVASCTDAAGAVLRQQGEFVISASGVEGGLIYALSAHLRDRIEAQGSALLLLDLAPGKDLRRVVADLSRPRGRDSMANHLRRKLGIEGVKAGLLRELAAAEDFADPVRLATSIKALPLRLVAPRPLDEAISSAGGVLFEALDERLMLRDLPGVFCAGEMLNWEAPTGGYLLSASLAGGRCAGRGAAAFLRRA